jgi:hypothetical protein
MDVYNERTREGLETKKQGRIWDIDIKKKKSRKMDQKRRETTQKTREGDLTTRSSSNGNQQEKGR